MASKNNPTRAFRLTHGAYHYFDPNTGEQGIARKGEKVHFTKAQAKAYSDMIIPWRDDVVSAVDEEFDSPDDDKPESVPNEDESGSDGDSDEDSGGESELE